jgi:hypothetical protein
LAPPVADRLEGLSQALELPLDVVLRLAARHEPLLLAPPAQLRQRLEVLARQALRLEPQDAAAALEAAPDLLTWPVPRLEAAAEAMWAVLGARGLQPAAVLQARPDLLAQSPVTVAAKLDALPAILGLSGRAARQLVSRRPDLLRRSSDQLRRRCATGGVFGPRARPRRPSWSHIAMELAPTRASPSPLRPRPALAPPGTPSCSRCSTSRSPSWRSC